MWVNQIELKLTKEGCLFNQLCICDWLPRFFGLISLVILVQYFFFKNLSWALSKKVSDKHLLQLKPQKGPKRFDGGNLLCYICHVQIINYFYRSTRSFTLFFVLRYFSLFKLKVLSNRLPLFSFSVSFQ